MQKREICPYYKNGFCVSPLLDNPSDLVVSPDRCFNLYKTCRYFVDNGNEESKGLTKFEKTKIEQEIKFYPKANLIQENIDSGCEFFQLMKLDGNFVALCKILNRVLTEFHAKRCSLYWEKCPLRKI